MALTVKGSPMTAAQKSAGEVLLNVAKQNKAPLLAMQAIIFAAIFESDLGIALGWNASNPTYGGILAGSKAYFGSLGSNSSSAVWMAEATSFLNGGNGYQAGGAIAASGNFTDPGLLATHVEAATVGSGSFGPTGFGQYALQTANGLTGIPLVNLVRSEAIAFVQKYGGGSAVGTAGGTSGGASTSAGTTQANFTVGNPTNPSEDFWTAINRLAQDRYWYVFSDGETLYLADGTTIMQQSPAVTVDRWADAERIVQLTFTWDNTAFQFVTSHKKRKIVQRKSSLAKISSPVEAELHLICAPDEIRAGDVVKLSGCGPGDGTWLCGTSRRSVFQVYSELTLVPALQPLTEGQAAGAQSNSAVAGAAASSAGSGTIMQAMLSAATTINNLFVSFVNWGGHKTAGISDVGKPGKGYNGVTRGYDSAGAVAAVLAAGGLFQGQVPDPKGVVQNLQQGGLLNAGQGSGNPEVTLFVGNGVVFLRLNGAYWGTSDTGGAPNKTPQGGTGGGWISAPPNIKSYKAYHLSTSTLGGFLTGASPTSGVSGYTNPFGQVTGLVPERIDMGVDYKAPANQPILAIGNARVYAVAASGTGWSSPQNTQAFVGYTLLDGQHAGKSIYVAEDIGIDVQANVTVTSGQQIAHFLGSSTGLETGWASGSSFGSLAGQLGQFAPAPADPGSVKTPAGQSFSNFLGSLGCPGGNAGASGPLSPYGQPLPAGYP